MDSLLSPALVFDLDGTLVDTAPDLLGAMNAILIQEGRPAVNHADLRHLVGHGSRTMLVEAFKLTGEAMDEARMPVIAAIQGGCIGGAVDMTSACDIRYASADAFFVIQEINIGMTADVGTFPRLCKLIPEGWVRELAYTGRRMPGRGAWLHPDPHCLELAERRRAFGRALRVPGLLDVTAVRRQLEGSEQDPTGPVPEG